MKKKWLFLPDIFLVLLVCMTCERNEMTHLKEDREFIRQDHRHLSVDQSEFKRHDQPFTMEWEKIYQSIEAREAN
ncbi:MAG: hypothetical protein R6V72_22180 [Cyclobacterium sp.]|uniref:hypothetical protein n=1 Tax=unclassified Cyclobacterium TaxID=2615055 RepID=UPI0013D6991C|nr:hypothetical protein [Cyclobacterium sp. SYSU L10401]